MRLKLFVAVMTVLAVSAWAIVRAQESHDGHDHGTSKEHEEAHSGHEGKGHSHEHSELHGGGSTMTQAHHFEIVYLADGIRVYTYDGAQKQISADSIKGEVTLTSDSTDPRTLDLIYVAPEEISQGSQKLTMHDYLFAAIDLSEAEPLSFRARFEFSNLPAENEETVEFLVPFRGVTERSFMCPMNLDVWGESADSKCPLCGMKTSVERTTGGL